MALILIRPEPAVADTYAASVADFREGDEKEALTFHLPVRTLTLEQLAKGAGLEDAAQVGCRFYAQWFTGEITSCEMTDPGLYGEAVFRNYVEGGIAKAGFDRIGQAHGIPQVQSQDFKLQLLTIPALAVEALYLTSTLDAVALVMPISSFDPEFPLDMVMDAPAFLATARKMARSRLAMRPKSTLSS